MNVKDAALLGLEVRQAPQKTLYYLGDQLDLAGLVVYAKYSDGASVRLTQQEYTVSPLDTTTAGTAFAPRTQGHNRSAYGHR